MKKMITFLTIALTTLVAFVSCANPTYSDKMIEVESKEVAFEIYKSDDVEWTVRNGWDGSSEVSVDEGVLTIKALKAYTQDVVKIDNPGATEVIVEYTSTGPVTFGFLTKNARPWDKRIEGADEYANPGRKLERVLKIPDGAGYLAICTNGDATNKITVKSIIVE